MNRRGHRLVKMVAKTDGEQKRNVRKKRTREESPLPPGNEQEDDYLLKNMGQNLDSIIPDNKSRLEVGTVPVHRKILSEVENNSSTRHLFDDQISKTNQRAEKTATILVQDNTENNVGDIVFETFRENNTSRCEHENIVIPATSKSNSSSVVIEDKAEKDVEFQKYTEMVSEPSSISSQSRNIVIEVQNDTEEVLEDIVVHIQEITSESIFDSNCEDGVDIMQNENLSVSMADIVLDSPTSSFTIPTPQSSAANTPEASPASRNCSKRRGPGKIRKQNITEWKDLKRKALKNSGKAFTNRKGETVPEKKMRSPCKCKRKCYEKVDQNSRKHIFDCFWKLGSHEKQWDFILKHVKSLKPKRIKSVSIQIVKPADCF